MTMMDKLRALTGLGRAGAFNPGTMLSVAKGNTGKRLSPKEREKQRKLREKEERKARREARDKRQSDPGGPPQSTPPGP
jgi:signal recognition particle subunit SRP54